MKRIQYASVSCFSLVLIACLTLGYHDVLRPFGFMQDRVVEIPLKSGAGIIASDLVKKKLIYTKYTFIIAVKLLGISKQLQAGIYEIAPGDNLLSLVNKIKLGDVITREFTIIEGSTLNQLLSALKKAPYLTAKNEINARVFNDEYESVEGLFLAETYRYKAGINANQILIRANKALSDVLENAWSSRDLTIPYTKPYEMLIAASIIEKETSLDVERRIISGVIVNRLKKKMRLQMDPTVIYGLSNNYNGILTRQNLRQDSPYNTYTRSGLPPTPIAMVGFNAINAAAHPIKTNYLYYVAKGDGSHSFSETYDSQKNEIAKYIKRTKL